MTTFSSFALKALPALALLGLASCQADIDAPGASAGSANFGRYLAVGNSLTAGYEDNGLYLEGQQNSYPSILAQQFARAGGGAFTQPLFTSDQANGSGYLRLAGFTAASTPITAAVTTNLAIRGGTATAPLYTRYDAPINNLGVPGIRLSDIQTVGYGSTAGNPYFERITTTATQTYFQRVKAEVAGTVNVPAVTFFSCWLGNNDVLGYATAGGAVASSGITRTDTFALKATRIINALTANNAKGIVSNIPDVTGVPFFATVGPLARASFAAANVPTAAPFIYTTGILAPGAPNTRVTTATLASIRTAAGGTLLLTLTASPYIGLYGQPTGRYWRDFYRQATGAVPSGAVFGGFLTALGVDTTRAFGQSTLNPFPSTLVLDETEQANVAAATTAFNSSLQTAANAKGLAFFDANTYFRTVATTPTVVGAVSNSASFITGNLFSLDGVHPTPRGYALIANEMIKSINAKYGSTIQPVNPASYRGVRFP
jgi:lysophospholipase L1-like esterase